MRQGIYPADFAAMLVKRCGEKYRPSNGTEGDIFVSMHCYHCVVDCNNCGIVQRTFAHNVEDPEYPAEWQYGKDGQPTCTAFRLVDEENVTVERCEHTADMFEAVKP